MAEIPDSYSDIPYVSCSYPLSHPDHLAVIGTLFGLKPQGLDGARILEIGCAGGGNLLPMAAALPRSRFMGIDLSPVHIKEAMEGATALNLGNVKLQCLRLEEVGRSLGTFDYIIAHGVYSWVAAPVKEQLLALCSRLLNPMGIAYISFNALPGSSTRTALRQMTAYHTRHVPALKEKVAAAREFFPFLELALKDRDDPYAKGMHAELRQIAALGDFYVAHEFLEPINDPCYLHEFVEHAGKHGLQFLADSEIQSMSAVGIPTPVRAGLRELASNVVEAEQYADFIRDRAFRQTLLCRSDAVLKRGIPPQVVEQFFIGSDMEPVVTFRNGGEPDGGGPVRFRDTDGLEIGVNDPLTLAALVELRAIHPAMLPFQDLLEKAAAKSGTSSGPAAAAVLAKSLLTCYSSSRSVRFQLHPPAFRTAVSAFPAASPMARWQATRGPRVTNLRHENVHLRTPEKELLLRLDGSCSRSLIESSPGHGRDMLEFFARTALLVS